MNQLCIFGDSWSYQSMNKLPDWQEVKGNQTFQKMFAEHGIVAHNKSIQGGSNLDTVTCMKDNLQLMIESDSIIVFQTDPMREVIDRKTFRLIKNFNFKKHSNLVDLARQLLIQFYNDLSNLQQTTNRPMLLIGGLSCLDIQNVPKNISTLPQSWTELATTNFVDCFFEWVDFLELVADHLNNQDELFETKKQIQTKNYVWQNSDAFGWCHPSDVGYKLMFDIIFIHLKELHESN